MDESEGEVERLEGVRRKVLRDLEEQQELQEALHAKVAALETDLKWEYLIFLGGDLLTCHLSEAWSSNPDAYFQH